MEDSEETTSSTIRRTRSGAKTSKTSPSATKPARPKPGPLSRKTRKKVVEGSSEEDDVQDKKEALEKSSEAIDDKTDTEVLEDKATSDEMEQRSTSESSETKATIETKEINEEVKKSVDEKVEVNGSEMEEIILNDVVMIEEEPQSDTSKKLELDKMETDEVVKAEETKTSDNKPKLLVQDESVTLNEPKIQKAKETKESDDKSKLCEDVATKELNNDAIQPEIVEEKVTESKIAISTKEKQSDVSKKVIDIASPKKEETLKETIPMEKEIVESIKLGEDGQAVLEVKPTKSEEKIEDNKENIDKTEESNADEEPQKKKRKLDETAEKEMESSEIKKDVPEQMEDVKNKDIAEELKVETKPEEKEVKIEKAEDKEETDVTEDLKVETDKEVKSEDNEDKTKKIEKVTSSKETGDPDAENISEDELPAVQAVKVPEAEEVSDEELPAPKRAELPADTEVVSEDELPSVKSEPKKSSNKRKLNDADYDPGSPTSENEAPSKKATLDTSTEKEKEEKPKLKKLPELDKYWKAVNDDPTDFTGWTYLLQYVDQENDMEAAREAYDAFLSHYPYCYGYWRKYADYEKRKGNKKKCEEVFERGLKAIPLSVDLWIHYLTYVKSTRSEDEEFIRSQFERALTACGLEFRSDRLWDSFIKWETEGKRLQRVSSVYDRLLATPTQGYTTHFDNFQEHISSNPPNKVIEVDEFMALRKEVRQQMKHDVTETPPVDSDAPPGDEDQLKLISSDEETKALRERVVSIRRKLHKATVNAVTSRWNYEEGIKRPYFHVKPLERCQLKNWQDYLDYETEQGDRVRIIVLFERCLIACALYEEFWMKFVHYLENLKDPELQPKIRDVYERACTIHHLKKPNLHLQWAMFEEGVGNFSRAAEILVNLEKSVPNVLQIAYRRINLERRRGDHEKCYQLYEHYMNGTKNKVIASSIAIKYSRFAFVVVKDLMKAQEVLKAAIAKDPNNPRLYLQLIDLTLQKDGVTEDEVIEVINMFLEKDSTDPEQKVLFAQRKLEYLEDFGSAIKTVQDAHEQYQKLLKINKDAAKKKEAKSEAAIQAASSSKSKEVKPPPPSSQSSSYGNYSQYGNPPNQASYPPYAGSQQGGPNYYPQYPQGNDQYQYQNWQYPQGGYGGYNQWGGYGSGYGY